MDLPADGFGHGHGSVAGSHEEESAGLGDGGAPVGGGHGEMVEAGFAGVAGNADNLSRTGIAQIQGLYMMANDCCAGEIDVSEGAIHDDSGRAIGFAADFAGQQRDTHSGKVAGGNEAVLSDDLGLRVGAAFDEPEFGLIPEGNSGNADGDSRSIDAGRRAYLFENAVGELAQFFHVAGFAPVHAELESKDVGGVKAGADAAELLKAPKKQAGAREQGDGQGNLNADQQPLQRISSGHLRAAGFGKRGRKAAANAANSGKQSAEKSDHHRAGQRIEDDTRIEMDFFDARKRRGQRAEDVRRRRREKEAEARADEGEEKSFREQLCNDRAARSA